MKIHRQLDGKRLCHQSELSKVRELCRLIFLILTLLAKCGIDQADLKNGGRPAA